MKRLAHRPITLVTGAAAKLGMGRASALLLARNGGRVCVSDVPSMEAKGHEVVEQIKKEGGDAFWVALDVSKEKDWENGIAQIEKTWGPLDVLVSNAGIARNEILPPDNLSSHSTEVWRTILSVNQDGVYFGLKHGSKSAMKREDKSRTASFINFSSVAGLSGTGAPYGNLAYTVSGEGGREKRRNIGGSGVLRLRPRSGFFVHLS